MQVAEQMSGPHADRIDPFDLPLDERKHPAPGRSGIAFASILLSAPLAIATFIALLVVGHSLIAALLMGWGVQILVFGIGLVAGLRQQELPAEVRTMTAQSHVAPREVAGIL